MCQECEELKNAIRTSTHAELLKMVGPSDEEIKTADERVQQINIISSRCEWGKGFDCSDKAMTQRERWNRIMRIQSEFEAKYF